MGEAPTSKKIDVSNLKGGRHALRAFLIPVAMPHLPKSLAPVRSAVVSLLRPRHHFSNLYTATDIAEALDVAANVSGNPAIDRGVDASLVLRAFAFDGMDEIFLSLKDVFGYYHFQWLLRSDPEFGPDSYGNSIRLYVERCYVMWRDMNCLFEDEGWKRRPEFKAYLNAIEKVPDLGNKKYADRTFFHSVPSNFFREMKSTFSKHTSKAVRSSGILIYLIGGNPTLSRMLLQWLRFAEEDTEPLTSYVFESKTIKLRNQGSKKGPVMVDTRRCMEYLTELADPEVMLADPKAMLADPLVSREKELLMTYAFAAKEVDLFDQSTWDGVDYEPLVDLVHELIVPHAVHQQLAESYVQSAALVAQTNVDEDRRSNRVNALSYVVRDFSKKAKAEIKAKTGKDVRRVESKDRVRLYSEHCDEFREKVDKAKAILGKEKYKDLVLFLQGDANRVSRIDLEARKVKYANGIQKPRKLTKAEQIKCGLDVPAEMDGGLRKKDIQRKYDAQIRAEIEF